MKYQRNDRFFTENIVDGADRARLNQAWNDLFGSWPYHDAYLGMLADHFKLKLESRRIQDMDAVQDRGAARGGQAACDLAARSLRRGDEGAGARPAGSRGGCADLRQPRVAAAADRGRKDEPAGLLSAVPTVNHLDHDAAIRALLARVLRVSGLPLSRGDGCARGPERPLNGWEMASRMSFFLWSSIPDDELRRAAAAGELS